MHILRILRQGIQLPFHAWVLMPMMLIAMGISQTINFYISNEDLRFIVGFTVVFALGYTWLNFFFSRIDEVTKPGSLGALASRVLRKKFHPRTEFWLGGVLLCITSPLALVALAVLLAFAMDGLVNLTLLLLILILCTVALIHIIILVEYIMTGKSDLDKAVKTTAKDIIDKIKRDGFTGLIKTVCRVLRDKK
ncbi:hypothetical protein ACFL3E_00015 [Patescibacteria group bacterium]